VRTDHQFHAGFGSSATTSGGSEFGAPLDTAFGTQNQNWAGPVDLYGTGGVSSSASHGKRRLPEIRTDHGVSADLTLGEHSPSEMIYRGRHHQPNMIQPPQSQQTYRLKSPRLSKPYTQTFAGQPYGALQPPPYPPSYGLQPVPAESNFAWHPSQDQQSFVPLPQAPSSLHPSLNHRRGPGVLQSPTLGQVPVCPIG
jgi:hypothetical protein